MDRDDARGSEAWKAVLDSLAIESPPNSPPEEFRLGEPVAGGILDHVTTKKPAPEYSAIAKSARGAKFNPVTLCGRPAKVSGVLRYNFVLR